MKKITSTLAGGMLAALLAAPGAAYAGAAPGEPGILDRTVRTLDDVAITNAIRTELARDRLVSAFDIGVETKKGVVTLRGNVKTEAEAQRAAEIAAKDRKNVVRVDNRIVVAAPAAHAAPAEPGVVGRTVRTLDDVAVTNAIRADLARDRQLSVFDIDVETKKGVVTLRGNVKTQAEAERAAEIAARDRKNVVRVDNRIAVMPTAAHVGASEPGVLDRTVRTLDDVAITNAIRAELARDKLVSAADVEVQTKQGVVTLRGNVRTQAEAERAAEIAARDRKNVVRVDNQITVTSPAAAAVK